MKTDTIINKLHSLLFPSLHADHLSLLDIQDQYQALYAHFKSCDSAKEALTNEIQSLHSAFAEETERANEAERKANVANARAEDYFQLYQHLQADYVDSLKSQTNWLSLSTSMRTPVYPGVGPQPPKISETPTDLPTLNRRRASNVARELTKKTLAELEREQVETIRQELENSSGDGDSNPTNSPEPYDAEKVARELWTVTRPGEPFPTDRVTD